MEISRSFHRRGSSLSSATKSSVDLNMEALFADDADDEFGSIKDNNNNFVGEMTILATSSPEIKALNLMPRLRPSFPTPQFGSLSHRHHLHRRSNSGSSVSSCSSLSSYSNTNSSRKRSIFVLPNGSMNLESMMEEESSSSFGVEDAASMRRHTSKPHPVTDKKEDIMDTSSTTKADEELIRSFQGLQATSNNVSVVAPVRSKLQYRRVQNQEVSRTDETTTTNKANNTSTNKRKQDLSSSGATNSSSNSNKSKSRHQFQPQRPPKCHRVHLRHTKPGTTLHRRGSFDLLPTPTQLLYKTSTSSSSSSFTSNVTDNPFFEPTSAVNSIPPLCVERKKLSSSKPLLKRRTIKRVQPSASSQDGTTTTTTNSSSVLLPKFKSLF